MVPARGFPVRALEFVIGGVVGDAEEVAAPRSSSSESLGESSGDDDGEGKNGNGVRRNKDARKY